MSTRSMIAGQDSMGMIRGIYCHWDGYIKGGVGETLKTYYNTPEKLIELVELGDLRCLKRTLDATESFHSRGEDWEGVCPEDWDNPDDYCRTARSRGADYIYLMEMDTGTWRVTRNNAANFEIF